MALSPDLLSAPAAIIVAAGQGLRAGQPVPKQFAQVGGIPVLRRSAIALRQGGVGRIVIAIPEGAEAIAADCCAGLDAVNFVIGGATRQASVRNALEALAADAPAQVLIHDAARPYCPPEVIARLMAALQQHPAAIPVLPVIDSLAHAKHGLMGAPARREALCRVQTPQAFSFADILAAHRAWPGAPDAGDDAQVARAAGLVVALVEGDDMLHKLTVAGDFPAPAPAVATRWPRSGTGFDVHRLAAGEELWLCGIRIDHPLGLSGHSDADVGLHAVVDAILGAIGAGDIGQHFPPSDPQWRGASSDRFVEHAIGLVHAAGYVVGNVDLTLICEAPKIGPHQPAMQQRLAELLQVGVEAVNVKATTTERLGFAGRGEGIAAQAIAMLVPAREHQA
ncbi:bifunctional 2-C-methyl-D-erythritol 4-phosphate cytidylyltransferase/2-C-methyl-D-erythritol 2,4-cyclodiphosphate synthase [Croceibacterium ferulae]|uniref:bifunctional 2-C-methyl-D-erythritol 4-phosphate cytidylyltransferase/2-C-methyl-D-erythritol 2,4-cyclodiphosphate synthase n=1 Tax=Croceibacterium ferulae TaxID=1854641 RepID=UPI000EB3E79F|nr:bifunctional 2-C-methyl-D-erythritol 4-phosphate cytidylyltransferase/2-C-methyl-D-erythritol 2,4-cyclodiphosphate synthase [Croceibacterium ferulae]